MSDIVSLEDRVDRFNDMTTHADIADDYGLLKTINLTNIALNRITTYLNFYLYTCLTAWYENKSFYLTDNLLHEYQEDILNLPNITPNGLVLPKKEITAAYNILHKEVAHAFCATGIGDFIDTIQYPINVRLQNGMPNSVLDNRPRSSVKPHTDIWAGDPAAATVVFLSLLGNPDNAGIRFLHTPKFPLSFVKPLEDYNDGKEVVDSTSELPCRLQNGRWFLLDPYMIHQTTKQGHGLRVSIDFRFIPKQRVASDSMGAEERGPYFISFDKWCVIGSNLLITTSESIKTPFKKGQHDYTVGYPVEMKFIIC